MNLAELRLHQEVICNLPVSRQLLGLDISILVGNARDSKFSEFAGLVRPPCAIC